MKARHLLNKGCCVRYKRRSAILHNIEALESISGLHHVTDGENISGTCVLQLTLAICRSGWMPGEWPPPAIATATANV